MQRKLYIGQEALKSVIAIQQLEKSIRALQSRLNNIEIDGLPGQQLRNFYSRKLEMQRAILGLLSDKEMQSAHQ